MVTTSTTAVASTTISNNGNMLLYNNTNNNNVVATAAPNRSEGSSTGGMASCNTAATLEQYRLQLYNYALNMERLRGPPYTAAAAMAAAAAYASTTTVSTATVHNNSGATIQGSNYTTTGQGPPSASYLCATTAGNLIAATGHIGRSSSTLAQCPTSNRLALASMSIFPQRIFQPEEPKPQHSYIGLIAMAILSSAETKLVLSDIYQYILDNYPYFRTRGPGWRNSIRHNLSLNDCFIKSGRSANGKGHYWAIHPANMEDFRKGDFRRRKAQRKVRKHMGLAVDDNGTDSPSPPPAMDLTSPSPPTFQHLVMGSSTITPLTTAAQHLAAQSFGWRFTQHHHRQPPHIPQGAAHVTNATAASYMGQIFTYRPQHYAAAAAAAAALCHNNSNQQQQQHHPQQQPSITNLHNSHHQHHSPDTPMISSTASLITSESSITATNNVQANVINELISQKRKRQFDVASLLAPDSNKRELHHQQQQQQYIRRYTNVSESNEVRPSSSLCNEEIIYDGDHHNTNDLDIEDIDVVDASEDEDIEADFDENDDDDDDVDSNSNNSHNTHSRSHSSSRSHNGDGETEFIQEFNTENSNQCKIVNINSVSDIEDVDETVIRVHDYEPDEDDNDDRDDDDDHDNINEENVTELRKSNNNNKNNKQDDKSIRNIFRPTSSPIWSQSQTRKNNSPQPPAIHSQSSTPQHVEHNNNDIQHTPTHFHHHHTSHSQIHPLPPMNAEAHNLFGRYYGTYMAAAAAARINSSSIPSTNIVGNSE